MTYDWMYDTLNMMASSLEDRSKNETDPKLVRHVRESLRCVREAKRGMVDVCVRADELHKEALAHLTSTEDMPI